MHCLISPDNTWGLWAILVGVAALSIKLEQSYKWAAQLTGCVLALLIMMCLANFRVIPTDAPAYDAVWGYVVPLAVPLLLFNCDIRKIGKEAGKLLIIYLLSATGTVAGALIGAALIGKHVPELKAFAAMFTGTYIGGSVNLTAMANSFLSDKQLISAGVVADNLLMAVYFFVLLSIPKISWFRKHYSHPIIDSISNQTSNKNITSEYWKAKPISLANISFDFAAAVLIVAVSRGIAGWFSNCIPDTTVLLSFIRQLLGNNYLIITTITMILATLFPKTFGQAAGANELGTFLIYIFFGVIGAPASIGEILAKSPILFVYASIIIIANMLATLVFGYIFKFSLEEMCAASNANIGGPTTAAAMAISQGWGKLVGPVLLVGTLGYVLGNYMGVLVANLIM